MITILGPTACGKTTFATHLAKETGGEIISADSRQVYRGMDIGTGKDISEYTIDGQSIPYHLIDIAEAGTRYNVYRFQTDFFRAYDDIVSRGATPILCGGTGLYIESVLRSYDFDGRELPEIENTVIGLRIDRELRREKITARLKARLEEGMIDEVRRLLSEGVKAEALIRYGLEYKYLTLHILGELSYEEMFTQLEIAIHQFAKRQMTWFRGMEKRGIHINWLDCQLPLQKRIKMALELTNKR